MADRAEHLSPAAAHAFLDALLGKIKRAIIAYADEMEYPVEAVLEIEIAGFLDPDSLSFEDCKPMSGAERDFGRMAS